MKAKIFFLTFLLSFHALGGVEYYDIDSMQWTTTYPSIDERDYSYMQLKNGEIISIGLQVEDDEGKDQWEKMLEESHLLLHMACVGETTGTGGSGGGGCYDKDGLP